MTEVLAKGEAPVRVSYHQFGLSVDDQGWPPEVLLQNRTNGLLDAAVTGACIHTGIAMGQVSVSVEVYGPGTPPEVDRDPWEEIVEISLPPPVEEDVSDDALARFRTPRPLELRVAALMDDAPDLPVLNAAGPGWYRVRVSARGRDHNIDGVDFEPVEEYLIQAWPGAAAPETVHKQTDAYGAGLRT